MVQYCYEGCQVGTVLTGEWERAIGTILLWGLIPHSRTVSVIPYTYHLDTI